MARPPPLPRSSEKLRFVALVARRGVVATGKQQTYKPPLNTVSMTQCVTGTCRVCFFFGLPDPTSDTIVRPRHKPRL